MKPQYATQRVELDVNSVETQTFRGAEHVVADATLVRQMILKGQFLPLEEIEASALSWNAKPSTISHPRDDDGNFIPASAPAQHETHVVGSLFNIDVSGDALAGQVYVDKERSAEVASSLDRDDPAEMLLDGETVEGSVGYWYEEFPVQGTFEGQEFDAVQVGIQPDHYALLPNAEGECSVADGCGVGRTSSGVNIASLTSPVKALYAGAESLKSRHFGANDKMNRAEKLAERTAFEVETLQEWDEDDLDALEASLDEQSDPPADDDEESKEENDSVDADELTDQIADAVMDRVDDRFEEFEQQQTADERQELVAQITTHTGQDAEALEDWSLQQLETMTEQVVPQRGVYAGASGSRSESSGDDFTFGLNGRHIEEGAD